MNAAAVKLTIEDPTRMMARVYLADRIYDVLLGREEAAKTGEILREIGMEDMTLRMIRHTLATSNRFEAIERKWTLATRFQDKQQPFERIVESVLANYGRPMPVDALAQELAYIFDRPVGYYDEILPRMLKSFEKFFELDSDRYGLLNWLITADSEEPEDVLFDNFMEESNVKPYRKAAAKVEWSMDDPAASAAKFISEFAQPVPVKTLVYLAWEALRDGFDPVEFYAAIESSDQVLILSTQEAVNAERKPDIMKALQEISTEIEEMPMEADEEAEAAPATVSETDRDEIVELILKKGGAVPAEEILETVIEMSPGERGYADALTSLKDLLTSEDRVLIVGPDRWMQAGTLPEYIYEVPQGIIIPATVPFETPEGEIYDQELEDDGLDAGLRQEILNPLVQDVSDEDPDKTQYQPLDVYQRCALTYHHKEAGTMPLIQFNPEFFGTEPDIQQIILVDESVRREVWINWNTRLMYGLKDFYQGEWPVSGAAFEIHKTERPGEFRFVYDNRTDAQVFVPTSRLLELLELKNEIETMEMPVFDVVTRILEHYRKGIGFIPLFTEVNLVKRVTRRLVASILSSYHCFHTRGKTGEWQYDEKKRSQGFNKTKKKYIRK